MKRVVDLDHATYKPHALHGADRLWTETNCYSDVIIELLHGLGHEPLAALAFTLAIDYEGDQWTFFKFPDADLLELYGLDIQELAVWRPLVEHISDQVAAGRPVLVELDSYFLPDTVGSAYKLAHVKTTVAVNEIDIEKQRMGYFHSSSYYAMDGADFADIFQLGGLVHERMLPPYIELVKPRSPARDPGQTQVDCSLGLLRKHLAQVPAENPFGRFKAVLDRDLEWLMSSGIDTFHTYSFANLRQYGACYELAATYLNWLSANGVEGVNDASAAYLRIAEAAKNLQFQLARSMARKRVLDTSPLLKMGDDWQLATSSLKIRFG